MSKKQTEKSRYPSKYSPGQFISPAQYILELICEKQAQAQHKTLPIKFWNLPEWKNNFIRQLRRVHKLLDKYDERAIIRAINNNKIYSLLAPWLEDKIKIEQKLLNVELNKISSSNNEPLNTPRPDKYILPTRQIKPNLLSRLDE